MLISNKRKTSRQSNEGHFIIIRESIYHEDMTNLSVYSLNNRFKIDEVKVELQGERENFK